MAYADYAFYASGYLLGKSPAVPEPEFVFWEKQAEREIDRLTFGRLRRGASVTDEVRECVCAVAELLYKAHSVSEQAYQEGAAGVLTSYSNDGQSGTYDVSQSIYTESGKKAEMNRLVQLYLGGTDLLYAGRDCHESELCPHHHCL